jgi:HD-like signal output (HDOD) protein
MPAESALTQDNIEDILRGIRIPSPPQIIADLQMEMAMPDPDLNEMADMISKDPGLAGGVLKTLNSPFYGHNDIASLSTGVMLLGMNTIANIINTLYLQDSVEKNADLPEETYKAMIRFWDSASDVAKACCIVAKKLDFKNPDMAYMLGLFHDAGIPLLMQRFPDYLDVMKESYLLKESRIVDVENQHYKTNHAVISFYAARSWKLPEVLCRVIAEHHNMIEIFSDKDNTDPNEKYYLAILKLGEHLVGLSQSIGHNKEDLEWQQFESKILEYLGLSQFDYEDLVGLVEDNGMGTHEHLI